MKRLTLIPLPLLCLAVCLSACSDKNREQPFEPETPPLTGNITVQLLLTGSSNLGAVGCGVMLDGDYCSRLNSGGCVTLNKVQPGLHTVAIVQVPKDCAATDGTSKAVRVLGGQTSEVSFALRCGDQAKRKHQY